MSPCCNISLPLQRSASSQSPPWVDCVRLRVLACLRMVRKGVLAHGAQRHDPTALNAVPTRTAQSHRQNSQALHVKSRQKRRKKTTQRDNQGPYMPNSPHR